MSIILEIENLDIKYQNVHTATTSGRFFWGVLFQIIDNSHFEHLSISLQSLFLRIIFKQEEDKDLMHTVKSYSLNYPRERQAGIAQW